MSPLFLQFQGAHVLRPGVGLIEDTLCIAEGILRDAPAGRAVDLSGYLILPGIVDAHGDGFERHLAPRRGAMKSLTEGLVAAEAELAANGITTAVLAQFYSWEGGLRGPDFAGRVLPAIRDVAPELVTDLRSQLRFETHLLDHFDRLPDLLAEWQVGYLVFNDHLPHDRLAEGRKPPRLTGQALKAGLNPDRYFETLLDLQARGPQVGPALDRLCQALTARGLRLGSHDDRSPEDRAAWTARGVTISEFPETLAAAQATRSAGGQVVMGAPNIVRGGSHNGNVSALDMVACGLCDALASDYHYPSPRRAALFLADSGTCDLETAWALVSAGPARVLGLHDRGRLAPGLRADLVILDAQTRRVAATVAGGRFSYLTGDLATRLFG